MTGTSAGYRFTPACSSAWKRPTVTPPKSATRATIRLAPASAAFRGEIDGLVGRDGRIMAGPPR